MAKKWWFVVWLLFWINLCVLIVPWKRLYGIVSLEIFTIIPSFNHFQDIKMFIYDFKITTIESIVNNASIVTKCSVNTRENPCDYTPKVYFTFVKEIPRPYLHFKITDLTTSINLVDQTVLLCAFTGANGLDTLMKTWWEKMLKNMDFPIKCPFPAVRKFWFIGFFF